MRQCKFRTAPAVESEGVTEPAGDETSRPIRGAHTLIASTAFVTHCFDVATFPC